MSVKMDNIAVINIEKLDKIRELEKQKTHINAEVSLLSAPLLSDIRRINDVYGLFVDIIGHAPRKIERKMFILIALYLFCPTSLIGGKARSGVRRAISSLFPGKSPSWVSNSCSTVLFHYRTYRCFRKQVDDIFSEIVKRMS